MKRLITSLMLAFSLMCNTVYAGIVDSNTVLTSELQAVNQAHILAYLDDQQVQDKLVALGVSRDEAAKRIASLTPAELKSLNQQINNAPAGGVIDLIFSVLIVVAVLDILGVTDAYSFIEPI
ncbi:hypothetical protein DS2_06236 [Catenovulum agarivorans DS-2]|uniref:PA2779 family protein n=1 Tax=Catenovulum agarivorans DS-2 TaxID=1328313 RepID=W7QPF5_9ALTE|nr:PA2779 family protein [Catenovulum agarivorans]EWH10867.1 hypothetical protein DS2_06236 [Catenovulum agarivorans DS-2]